MYRVFDLPPSMRPLVYDFGQLNNATENDYIQQIVKDRFNQITVPHPTVQDKQVFEEVEQQADEKKDQGQQDEANEMGDDIEVEESVEEIEQKLEQQHMIQSIAKVFSWSQCYMRDRHVSHCSQLAII